MSKRTKAFKIIFLSGLSLIGGGMMVVLTWPISPFWAFIKPDCVTFKNGKATRTEAAATMLCLAPVFGFIMISIGVCVLAKSLLLPFFSDDITVKD